MRRILAARRDDEPRIAYAEALGADPRGEFIKVQLALAGASTRVGVQYASRTRERALLEAHRKTWAAAVKPLVEAFAFRRGFVEWIVSDVPRFLKNGDAIVAKEPILDVVLTKGKGSIAALAAFPAVKGLRSLSLAHQELTDADAKALAGSALLADLRWLDLSGNRLGEAGFEAIAASPHLRGLRWVGFAHNPAPDPTPQPMEDHGAVHGESITSFGEALRTRYPGREWLLGPGLVKPDPWIY